MPVGDVSENGGFELAFYVKPPSIRLFVDKHERYKKGTTSVGTGFNVARYG